MGTGEQSPNPPLTWLSNEPVWVDQWPMTAERLQITRQLVAEQLDAGHIKPSFSLWNTPIFIIPKKSDKWRLLHDLRNINEQMQPMGALQPGMPSPAMLPSGWNVIIVDLKDCFFTISLHPQDTQRFAFSVPVTNKAAPSERYEWVVLPQGMRNSPTLCQLYVAWALAPLRKQWPNTIIYHYMDGILCCQQEAFGDDSLTQLSTVLASKGLVVAPEKIQRSTPWKYLGWRISDAKIQPQKGELATNLRTLTDVQTLLGDILWVCNCAGISNAEIAPLTSLLCGSHPSTKVTLSETQQTTLQHIVQKLQTAWTARRLLTLPVSLLIRNQEGSPCALVCQWQNKKRETQDCAASSNSPASATDKPAKGDDPFYILEWVFLSVQPKTRIQTRSEAIGELIRKGRTRVVEMAGQEPEDISIPVKAADLEWWLRHALPIQEALLGYGGRIQSQQSKGKLWQVLKRNQWLEKPRVQEKPLAEGVTVYTDAGRRLRKAVCAW